MTKVALLISGGFRCFFLIILHEFLYNININSLGKIFSANMDDNLLFSFFLKLCYFCSAEN